MPDTDTVAQTRVFVEHEVMFLLAPAERFVVPRRHVRNGYAQVDGITVHFHSDGRVRVWAGGIVCRKDGTFSEHWGRANVTVDLPDEAPWIERARVLLIDGSQCDS
jgi:hypothetical protein